MNGRYIPTGIYWDSRLIKRSIPQGEQRRTLRDAICVGFSTLDLLTSQRVTQPPDGTPAAWRKEVAHHPPPGPWTSLWCVSEVAACIQKCKVTTFPRLYSLHSVLATPLWFDSTRQLMTYAGSDANCCSGFQGRQEVGQLNTQLWAHSVKNVLLFKKNEKTSEILLHPF